jgi:hypothetical protein
MLKTVVTGKRSKPQGISQNDQSAQLDLANAFIAVGEAFQKF